MKHLFSLTFSLLFIFSFAQTNTKPKWGKVSQYEIDYKQVPFDTEAGAVILYEEGNTNIANSFETKVYKRIKILNDRGLDAANQELTYYSHNGLENISSLKAQTLNTENGKTFSVDVDNKSFFETQLNEFWSMKKFAFPDVKVGSILEFEYTVSNKRVFIDAWTFQHRYPTLYSKYDFQNQSSIDFTVLALGDQAVKYTKAAKNPSLNNWVLKNIPAYGEIEMIYNPKDAVDRIVFQVRGYENVVNQYHSETQYQSVMGKWTDLNRDLQADYSKYIVKSVGKEIAALIPDGKTDTETLLNIYNYFKANYSWNSYYGISARKTNREVQKEKTGNSADLNLLLNNILTNKGFAVDLVLISTRDNGKLMITYPYLGQFNSLVNLVKTTDGNSFLIDASDLSLDLGYAPLKNYNYYGLIIDPTKENIGMLHPLTSYYQSVQNYAVKNNQFMQRRIERKNGYFKQDQKDEKAGLKEYNPILNSVDLLTIEINRQSKNNEEDNFLMERIQSETAGFGNSSFIAVQNPLKQIVSWYKLNEESRERALEFDFPFLYKTDVTIDIPAGYKAEIPANYNTEKSALSKKLYYTQKAEVANGKLTIHVEFFLGRAIFEENYNEIKTFFDQAIAEANKSILLKKS